MVSQKHTNEIFFNIFSCVDKLKRNEILTNQKDGVYVLEFQNIFFKLIHNGKYCI